MNHQGKIADHSADASAAALNSLRLKAERVKMLYGHAPASMIATVVNVLILTVILWGVTSRWMLLAWLALNLLIVWPRYLLVRSYRCDATQLAHTSRWAGLFICGLILSGITMGSAGIFLLPQGSFVHQVFIAFMLGGMVAGAAGSYAPMIEAFAAYSVPTVAPLIVRFMLQGSEIQIAMGGMLLLFSLIMAATAYNLQKNTFESLRLRFENTDLVAHLTEAKARSDAAVESLKTEVSERKRTEEALRESEQQFRMLVETMNEGLGVQDEHGVITYVNDKLCEMLGYSREELIGLPASALLDGANRRYFEEELAQKRLRKRTSSELELVTKNRRKIPTIVFSSPVFDAEGRFKGAISVVADITILKRAEKALQESEEKYRLIFEKSPLGIVHFDRTGTITAYNDNLAAMSGRGRQDLIGLNLPSYVQDQQMRSALAACLSGEPGHYEGYYRWLSKGNITPMKADFGPIHAEDGSVLGGIGIIEDISGRKRMEEELQEQLHFLQTLIDTIPNPIFYKDNRGRYLGCNKVFEARLGLRKEMIIGKTALELLPDELAERYQEMDQELFRQPGEQAYESTLLYADGREHDVIVNKATFTNADGSLGGLVGVTVDITERKRAEEALRAAHDELEMRVAERTAELAKINEELRSEILERGRAEEALRESSEKLKLFAYSVAHDLKSPTIGIYGLARLLNAVYKDVLDDKGRNYCEQILKAAEHVVALVEKINIYAATKESPLNIEVVSLKELLKMVKDEFSVQFSIRQVKWFEPEETAEIKADMLSLLRILRNLVDNALKYGGERLSEIRIGYKEASDYHVLSVSDNGIGLKREDSQKIFGPFQRDESSRGIEGSGLGLAIVKEIAERHGGTVWVESQVENGTTFFVSISKYL